MEQIFYMYNPHWENIPANPDFVERPWLMKQLISEIDNKRIVFITGLRRIGKTTLMKMLMRYLYLNKCKTERVFYISADNYSLREKDLSEIINTYRQIHKLKHDDFVYVFFDEITYVQDFEIQLKNLYDLGFCKIFASSSNASLLKSKKSYLTGRSFIVDVPALDYNEYLRFKKIEIKVSDGYLYEEYFTDFLKTGGIPEFVLTKDVSYIQNLVDDIIYKDIVSHYRLRNPKLLQDFFLLLMERSGKQFSINKIASILKISTETAKRYLEYFSDTYLISLVERYGTTNERLLSPKKIYSADIGIRNFFIGYRDIGAIFENYVYLKIKHFKPRYLYENKTEIDFITENNFLIEAKYKNARLTKKQETLFNGFNAKQKFVLRTQKDIEALTTQLQSHP